MGLTPRFSIITPTILRVTADRTMESVDAQTSDEYEHVVVVDGPIGDAPERWLTNPRRRIIRCGERHNDSGATCRAAAVRDARGEYILYIDDDDYYLPAAVETLARLVGEEPFGVFPIRNGGAHWFPLPPGPGRTASCQLYHRRVIGGEIILPPHPQRHYSEDSVWAGHLADRYGWRALECSELAVVERGHNSSDLPGGPPRVELASL